MSEFQRFKSKFCPQNQSLYFCFFFYCIIACYVFFFFFKKANKISFKKRQITSVSIIANSSSLWGHLILGWRHFICILVDIPEDYFSISGCFKRAEVLGSVIYRQQFAASLRRTQSQNFCWGSAHCDVRLMVSLKAFSTDLLSHSYLFYPTIRLVFYLKVKAAV